MRGSAVLSLAVVLLIPAESRAGAGGSLGQRRQILTVADGLTRFYYLEHGIVVAGSESVFVDGEPVPESLYDFDVSQGLVLLRAVPRRWAVVRVSYRALDFGDDIRASGRYAGSRHGGTAPAGEPPPAAMEGGTDTISERPFSPADTRGLTLTGSKSLSFSAGTAGAGLEQATRIAVGGQFEGVKVDAELSDQNSPISPEGTTRELEELDRIVVDVKGRGWRGTFGDVGVEVNAGALGMLERRATGAVVAGSTGPLVIEAAYARPRGKYGRVELRGIERVQGPYLLAPDGRGAQIVPGSEEVFLDGNKMTRGWDEDYTIDYSTGELLFTPRHVIDGRSRIEVGFQYVTDAYERAVTGGEVALGSGSESGSGQLELAAGFFREGDDPNQYLLDELSELEKEYLGSIGRDTARAWLSGAAYVGPGAGDYERVADYFRFVGRGRGDYRVRFTYVGESRGAYVYSDSTGAFVYAGAGRGAYADSIRVALPERDEAAVGRFGFSREGLVVRSEGAFLRRCVNLFSETGGRADAAAAHFELGWHDSVYDVRCRYTAKAAGFSLPGRSGKVDFSRTWGGVTDEERRSSAELMGAVKPLPEVELWGELGRLLRFGGREVDRVAGGIRLWRAEWTGEKVAAVTRHRLTFAPRIVWLQPSAGMELETDDTARVLGVSLGAGSASRAGPSGRIDGRLLDYWGAGTGGWVRDGRGSLVQSVMDWSPGEGYRLEGVLAHQARWPWGGSGPTWSQLQGNFGTTLAPRAGLKIQADGGQSYRRLQLRDEHFFYVGPRQGQYRLDSLSGRFVYDPDGEYRRELVATDRFAAAREMTGTASIHLSEFSPWALSATASVNRASADTGILNGSATGDLRVEVDWGGRVPALAAGMSGSSSLDRTLVFTGREARRLVEFVEFFGAGQVLADMRLRFERVDAVRRYSATLLDYTEAGWASELKAKMSDWLLGIEIAMGLQTKVLSEPALYPQLGSFRVHGVDVVLSRTLQVGQQTRVYGSAGLAWWASSVGVLPYDIALVSPPGL
ncbi:MAG: hypothetical protein ABIK37_03480, partial [candidate division WOR-3 bacterium]